MKIENKKGKTPAQTIISNTELILPAMSNLMNNLQGGQMMHFMDIAGALTCRKHAGCEVATVSVDRIEFKYPVKVGDVITITSKLIWVGRTSMKVKITVFSENLKSGETKLTNTAYFVFVALDENIHPVEVPKLLPQTKEEQEIFDFEQNLYEKLKLKNK